jgi:hypothetical protein
MVSSYLIHRENLALMVGFCLTLRDQLFLEAFKYELMQAHRDRKKRELRPFYSFYSHGNSTGSSVK